LVLLYRHTVWYCSTILLFRSTQRVLTCKAERRVAGMVKVDGEQLKYWKVWIRSRPLLIYSLALVVQNNMIPTSGETKEPSKTASNKSSTIARTLAGNTRTTKEATNKPRNQVIFKETEIVHGQKKKHNIYGVAEVTSAVFRQGRGVIMNGANRQRRLFLVWERG